MANPVFQPVRKLALRNGVKAVAYGPPGSGKTPLIKTAPRPVMCVCEPGMMSMRDCDIPACEAYSIAAIDDFFAWLKKSNEAKNFDTVCIDSVSQMAETSIKHFLDRNKDGRKAYGEMSRHIMDHLEYLFFMPFKHTYLIAKQATVDMDGVQYRRPYFPGQDLNVKVPHLYDCIFHVAKTRVPNVMNEVLAVRAIGDITTMARDRSGFLPEYNPPNLTDIFNTCMGNAK